MPEKLKVPHNIDVKSTSNKHFGQQLSIFFVFCFQIWFLRTELDSD